MPWIAAATIGSSLIGAGSSLLGSNAQTGASDLAANISNDQYLQSRADLAPWRNSGVNALARINDLMGLGGANGTSNGAGGVTGNGATAPANAFATPIVGKLYPGQSGRGRTPIEDIQAALAQGLPVSDASWAQAGFGPGGQGYYPAGGSAPPAGGGGAPMAPQSGAPAGPDAATAQQNAFAGFRTDPGYQFSFDQGQRAVQNSAAARGILNSGATAKALTQFGTGLADQQYTNYFNRLASVAGLGQTATNTTGQLGANAAGQTGNAFMNAGNARASGYGGVATSANQGMQNYLLSNLLNRGAYGPIDSSVYVTPSPGGFG